MSAAASRKREDERLAQILHEMAECGHPWPDYCLSPMRVHEVLRKLTLGKWTRITWLVDGKASSPTLGISLRIELWTKCPETGIPQKVSYPASMRQCSDEAGVLRYARKMLVEVMAQEVDRFLSLDGVPLKMPKEEGRTWEI